MSACRNDSKPAAPAPEKAQKDSIPAQTPVVQKPVKPHRKLSAVELEEKLKPVQENVRRINTIQKWSFTSKKDLGETTEGGEADFYYLDGRLEKIVMRQFGETFQKLTEFYMLDGELSFAFEKESRYNRPIYWDSTAMIESGDNQTWDAEKSEVTEIRNYFVEGKLLRQDNTKAPARADLFPEEKRLTRQFTSVFPEPLVPSKNPQQKTATDLN